MSLQTKVVQRRRIIQRRARVALLFMQGYSSREITDIFHDEGIAISHTTIRLDLKALEAEWMKQGVSRTERVKLEVIQGLRRYRVMCERAYDKSCQPEVITTTKTYLDENGEPVTETTVREKPQEAGDPRWLAEARENLRQLASVAGLDQITQHIDHGGDGYSADVARALEEIAENLAKQSAGGPVHGLASIPVVDSAAIEAHVNDNGNGEVPAIEHNQKGESDDDQSTEGDEPAGQGDAPHSEGAP